MNLVDVISYKLCAYPAALFELQSLMRKANKSQLAEATVKFPKHFSNKESDNNMLTDSASLPRKG